jgi:putative transposase
MSLRGELNARFSVIFAGGAAAARTCRAREFLEQGRRLSRTSALADPLNRFLETGGSREQIDKTLSRTPDVLPVRKRHSPEQIAVAVRQTEAGTCVAEIVRKLGVYKNTFYTRKRRFGGLGMPEIREPRRGLVRLRKLSPSNREIGGPVPRGSKISSCRREVRRLRLQPSGMPTTRYRNF